MARSDYLLALILTGGDGMPAFHARLTEGEIVTVANHVRTSWGNGFEPVEPALLAAQWWQGAEDEADLYRRVCARCHGTEGGGKIGPPLAGNDNLADGQYVAGKILHGQGGMPAFEGILGLRTISALASHIRRSFGNDFGAVELELVRALATAEPGELRVSVVPEHSRLAILGPDGYRRFVTSAGHESLPGLEPGTYGITASKAGYRAAAGVARVRSGEVSGVLLRLEPISLAEDEAGRASRSRTLLAARPQLGPGAENRNGRKWYQASCALCHGPAGQGGVGPPLAGNGNVEDLGFVIQTILNGSGRMPAFADRLTDEPIAAIAYFERTSWGNEFGVVSEEQVAEQRVRADGAGNGPSTRNSANQIYQANCSICHGGVGGGGAGPPLAANRNLADLPYVISRIVMGGGGMPPFNQTLSSSDIAQVTSLIRNSWGNDYGSASLVEAQNYHGGPSSLTP